MAILMIIIFNKIINEDKNDAINDAVNDAVNDAATEGITEELLPEDATPLPITDIVEEPKPQERIITLEDLPERNNRGFSVNIPDRKSNNSVERIGSNKEVRENEPGKVFFKKRG